MKLSLHELTGIYHHIEELEDAVTPEDYDSLLKNAEGNIEDKLEGIGKVLRNLEAQEKYLKEEADRLTDRAKGFKRKREELKAYTLYHLQSIGMKKVQTPMFSYSVRPGRASVKVLDPSRLPEHLITVEVKPRKTEIGEAIKRGELSEDIAVLVDGKESLVIR